MIKYLKSLFTNENDSQQGYDIYLIKNKYDESLFATFSLEHAKELTKGTRHKIIPCWFPN